VVFAEKLWLVMGLWAGRNLLFSECSSFVLAKGLNSGDMAVNQ